MSRDPRLANRKGYWQHESGILISEQIKSLKLAGQATEFKFEFKFVPCLSSAIWLEGFDCKNNGLALRAALRLLSQAQLEKNVLPLLLYWLRSRVKKVLMVCKYGVVKSRYFCNLKWNFDVVRENLLQTKAGLISSFNRSIIYWSLSGMGTNHCRRNQHVPKRILCIESARLQI